MSTQTPSERLSKLDISLPNAPKPLASYVPARVEGGLLYVSGQLPFEGGTLQATGPTPSVTSAENARHAARLCAINALAAASETLGSIDRIAGVVRVGAFVACDPGFGGQPAIANGASDLMFEVFGESGRHARAAVGVMSLPLDATVEIEFTFTLHPQASREA